MTVIHWPLSWTSNTLTCCKRLLCVCVCVMVIPWQSVVDGLVQKNHVTQLLPTPDSVVQAVVRQGERLCAESDPRKGGYPAGYWPGLQGLLYSSQSGQSPQRHSGRATIQRCLHWRLKAVFKLWRHSHPLTFTQTWKRTPFQNLFYSNSIIQHFISFFFSNPNPYIFEFWSKIRGCT